MSERSESGRSSGEFSSPGSAFCDDSYLGICFTIPVMLPKVQVAGYSYKTHASFICAFE